MHMGGWRGETLTNEERWGKRESIARERLKPQMGAPGISVGVFFKWVRAF